MATILFRRSFDHEGEFEVARKYFNIVERRNQCPPGELIIGRYSVLPYHDELEKDLYDIGCKLINTTEQHNWVANFDYYDVLREYTAETWTDHDFYLSSHPGPFVVKGRTNSRKNNWASLMFAENRRRALEIASELMNDPLIGPQGVIYRKYEPLVKLQEGINGLPFTNEWRFFFYREHLLSHAFYWSQSDIQGTMTDDGVEFAMNIAKIAKESVNFFVLDIAEKQSGGWMLVEVNSGPMSGLSCNNPDVLYSNFAKILSS